MMTEVLMIDTLPSLPDGSTTGVRGNHRVPKEDQGKSDAATDTFIPLTRTTKKHVRIPREPSRCRIKMI